MTEESQDGSKKKNAEMKDGASAVGVDDGMSSSSLVTDDPFAVVLLWTKIDKFSESTTLVVKIRRELWAENTILLATRKIIFNILG